MSSSFDIMWAKFWARSRCNCMPLLSLSWCIDIADDGELVIPGNELIIPGIKFISDMWQYHRLCLRCQQAQQPGCDLFEKVQEGICCFGRTRTRCQGQHQGHGAQSRRTQAGLHLCSLVWRLNQLRHKYFYISHTGRWTHFFLIEYYSIFGFFTWCSRTIEFIFIPVEKNTEGWCILKYYFKYLSTSKPEMGKRIFGSNNQS